MVVNDKQLNGQTGRGNRQQRQNDRTPPGPVPAKLIPLETDPALKCWFHVGLRHFIRR
jgi:hypothetical protein